MEEGAVCSICVRSKPAVVVCTECADTLCPLHCEAHKESRATEGHHLLDLHDPILLQLLQPPATLPATTPSTKKRLEEFIRDRRDIIEREGKKVEEDVAHTFALLHQRLKEREAALLKQLHDAKRERMEVLEKQEKLIKEASYSNDRSSSYSNNLRDLVSHKKELLPLLAEIKPRSHQPQNLPSPAPFFIFEPHHLDSLLKQVRRAFVV